MAASTPVIVGPRDGCFVDFGNAGDAECRILEIISPSGFERFFAEMGEASESGGYADPTVVGARYGVEFDFDSIERICKEHGLRHQAPS